MASTNHVVTLRTQITSFILTAEREFVLRERFRQADPAVTPLRKTISSNCPGFEVEVQTHWRIVCAGKPCYESQEFDNRSPRNGCIERNHAWLRNFRAIDVAIGYLSSPIRF